ncbi:hypothetical protein M513_04290 [Trichuris suis]|uniref:Uncharacterized protein n=1 Tax=Trichuris suis TaxID=68888 RepID=A0A085MCB0_9BILA|nr:hypothetical protein M513_04290 [Trichuris suis]
MTYQKSKMTASDPAKRHQHYMDLNDAAFHSILASAEGVELINLVSVASQSIILQPKESPKGKTEKISNRQTMMFNKTPYQSPGNYHVATNARDFSAEAFETSDHTLSTNGVHFCSTETHPEVSCTLRFHREPR